MPDSKLRLQRNEITEHNIYKSLAKGCKHEKNRRILERIASDELIHYHKIKEVTKREVSPNRLRIFWYVLLARTLGLSFALKLMERGEEIAQEVYKESKNPVFKRLWKDEMRHEKEIIRLIDDERVEYAGSIVLGLNDALVELTGALAGFTLALQNTRIIALIGIITGFAASLSMAASGFLSAREDPDAKNPVKGAIYTGIAYIIVVVILIIPYIFMASPWAALVTMLVLSILIVAGYTYYISVAKELTFSKRFLEMATISLGVAIISFGMGMLLKTLFGVDM